MVEPKETAKKSSATDTKLRPDLIQELKGFRSDYEKCAQQAEANAASATEKAWKRYLGSTRDIAGNVERVWIESYKAYLDAYQKLPLRPDDEMLESVRNAWAAHVTACNWSPDLVGAWNSAFQTLLHELQGTESSFAEALRDCTEGYSKKLRAALTARGVDNLSLPALQFTIQQVAAITAATAG